MAQDTEHDNWQRHPDFYMPDGTIVLLADSTLFRVYAGSLARHSSVLRGLIDSAQHLPEDAEVYDGCPLIELDDDPEDVAYFLKAIMGLWDPPMSYSMASSILRFSTKYHVRSVRPQAVEYFKHIIPRSQCAITNLESYKRVFGSDEPHPFQLLPLFREHGLKSFLPWTYYSACVLGFEKLVQGDTMHNGKEIRLDMHDAPIALLGWRTLCDMISKKRHSPSCGSSPYNYCHGYSPIQVEKWESLPKRGRDEIWSSLPAIFALPDWEVLKKEDLSGSCERPDLKVFLKTN